MNGAGCVNNCDHLMSFTIARNSWQGPHATVCPQPEEADISPNGADSRFDVVDGAAVEGTRSAYTDTSCNGITRLRG
jgi:hypothetical protein